MQMGVASSLRETPKNKGRTKLCGQVSREMSTTKSSINTTITQATDVVEKTLAGDSNRLSEVGLDRVSSLA